MEDETMHLYQAKTQAPEENQVAREQARARRMRRRRQNRSNFGSTPRALSLFTLRW